MTRKFSEHLPLYRISEVLGQLGIGISRQILSQRVLRCDQALKPLYNSPYAHADVEKLISLTFNSLKNASHIALNMASIF